jgi:hypothetical protein
MAAALEAAAFRGPVHEPFHVVAILPGEMEKLYSRTARPAQAVRIELQ